VKSEIKVNKKKKYPGYFSNKLDAAKVRYKAECEYNYIDCDKTSTALAYIKSQMF
jgi:hypothetical protein